MRPEEKLDSEMVETKSCDMSGRSSVDQCMLRRNLNPDIQRVSAANRLQAMPVINGDCSSTEFPSICAGCGGKIIDRYYLLAVDKQWHVHCLTCCECKIRLDSELTCFAKDGSIYCKDDYYRRFSVKRCARCHMGISANELVMRAKELVYHVNCFTCASCNKPLTPGEHFGMKDSTVYCRTHYDFMLQGDYLPPHMQGSPGLPGHPGCPTGIPFYNGVGAVQKGRPRKPRKSPALDLDGCGSLGLSEGETDMEGYTHHGNGTRTKRMRTSFKHHQLRTMKSYFALNHNPDAKDLKQLAQKTGLTKRVLQVWFQNARAKYRRNLLRQEQGKLPEKPGSDGSNPVSTTPQLGDLQASSPSLSDISTGHSLTELHDVTGSSTESPRQTLEDLF